MIPRSPMTSPLCPTLRVILRVPIYWTWNFLCQGLTNSGGAVSLMTYVAAEDVCSNSDCSEVADTPFRAITAGELVSPVVATPEPPAFLLVGIGLVCLPGVANEKCCSPSRSASLFRKTLWALLLQQKRPLFIADDRVRLGKGYRCLYSRSRASPEDGNQCVLSFSKTVPHSYVKSRPSEHAGPRRSDDILH